MDGSAFIYLQQLVDDGVWRIFWNQTSWALTSTNFLGWPIPNYGPALLPLWFLRELIVMAILSPLVYQVVKRGKVVALVILGILSYSNIWFVIPGVSTALFIRAIFYFSLGAYFSIHGKNLVSSFQKGAALWMTLALILMCISVYFDGNVLTKYFKPLFVFFGVISAINITSYFVANGRFTINETLSQASFFIYTAHGFLIQSFSKIVINRSIDLFLPETAFSLTAKYVLGAILTVIICLVIYLLAKKVAPKTLGLFTGNR